MADDCSEPLDDPLHWGSFNDKIKPDLKNTEKLDPKPNWSFFEVPPLHQPCSSSKANKKEVSKKMLSWLKPSIDSKGQNYLLQSIELQHYKRRMRYMLTAAHSHQMEVAKGISSEAAALPSPPPPPKRFCSNEEGRLTTKQKSSFLSEEYDATGGKKSKLHVDCPITLDTLSTRQLMLKSVAAVCAHSGFETATDSSLNTLTDIIVDQQQKFCRLLKSSLQKATPTQDPMDVFDHVLQQSGLGCTLGLQEYWNTRVKQVALALEKEDLELLEEYNSLKESSTKPVVKDEKG